MSDLKLQGVVEMSSEGAERAFDRVGQKAGQMSQQVASSSAKASDAVDSIGSAAQQSADGFTRAEGKIVASIKRATAQLESLGKTASQKVEIKIDAQGLDRAKFEPLLANLRQLESAQQRVTGSSGNMRGGMQNLSYQLQDFIVQTNGGVAATTALSMQLPQLLAGFGAAGAAMGVVAALLPNLVKLFGDAAGGAASLKDAMSGVDHAISQVGRGVRSFDMEGLYEQFNAASGATRAATIEQLKFQQAFIETQRLVAQKSLGESISGVGDYGFLDKLSGKGTAASRIADDLGVTLDLAQQLEPALKGLRAGTQDVGSVFTEFGTRLLGGNKAAVELAKSLGDLSANERDAYAASSALSDALERMAKGHVRTKKETDEAAKAAKTHAAETQRLAEAGRELAASLLGQSAGLSRDFYAKWAQLGQAYKTGAINLQDLTTAQSVLLAQQPAMKQAAQDADAYGKAVASVVGPLEARAFTLETELQNYGLTQSQIERTTLARYEEVRALAAANGATQAYLSTLDREIEARRRIAEASAGLEAADANKRAAAQAAQDWQRTADAIEKSLIDALMEGGKSGAEYIEGLFRSMVLRPIIQAVVQPVAGGITSAMGLAGAGQGGGLGGALGAASNLQTLYGAVTGGITASLGGLAASAGSLFGSSALSAFGAGLKGSTLAAGLAGPTTAGAGGAMGLGASLGAALPWVAGGLAVASLFGVFDKKPSDKTSWASYNPATGQTFNAGSMTGKKDPGQQQRDATAALAALVGGFAGLAGVTSSLTAMTGARDGMRLSINRAEGLLGFRTPGAGLANGGNALNYGTGEDAIKRMLDDLVDEGTLPQATVAAWRSAKTDMRGTARDATELVSTLNLLVSGYDTATIERANLLQQESEALEVALSRMLQIEGALTAAAQPGRALADSAAALVRQMNALSLGAIPTTTEALGKLIAGLDVTTSGGQQAYQALMALAPAFVELQATQRALYEQLDTDEQRAARRARELGEAFAQLGVLMPDTREQMRALIDTQDATRESGARMRAQLLSLVPAFVEVADAAARAAADAAAAALNAAKAAAAALADVLQQIQSARADVASSAQAITGGPKVMTAQQIAAAIAAAQVSLPSAAAAIAANTALGVAYSKTGLATLAYDRAQSSEGAATSAQELASAGLSARRADRDAAIGRYQAQAAQLYELLAPLGAYANAKSGPTQFSNDAYAYNPATNRLAGFGQISLTNMKALGALNQLMSGQSYQDLVGSLSGGNATLKARDAAVASAQVTLDKASAALATATANRQSAASALEAAKAAQSAAEKTLLKEQDAYGRALRAYAADASVAVDRLSALREETVRYYESQRALADTLVASAARLRDAITDARRAQMEPDELLREQRIEFDRNYSMALSTQGAVRAGYADKMAALLPPLVASLADSASSRAEWLSLTARMTAQSTAVAQLLENEAPANYESASLALLDDIDGSLAAIQSAALSAEKIISDAIYETGDNTLDGLRAVIAAIQGAPVPAFATGAAFTNTVVARPTAFSTAVMGEAGPEAIMPLASIGGRLGVHAQMPGIGPMLAELRALRAELTELKAINAAAARHAHETSRTLSLVTNFGTAMLTEPSA